MIEITEEVHEMSSHDAVGATREALTSLAAAVLRVRNEYGDTLGVRRLTSDVDRISEPTSPSSATRSPATPRGCPARS